MLPFEAEEPFLDPGLNLLKIDVDVEVPVAFDCDAEEELPDAACEEEFCLLNDITEREADVALGRIELSAPLPDIVAVPVLEAAPFKEG